MVIRRFHNGPCKQIISAWLLVLFSGCATVNVPSLDTGVANLEKDEDRLVTVASRESEALDHSGVIYDNVNFERYINKVLNQIIPHELKASKIHFQVKVINDPSLNAFAMPNGSIYIHTGILAAMNNEAQLAILLAHEATHVLNRHQLKMLRSANNSGAWWEAFGLISASVIGGAGMLAGQLAKLSSMSGYSQGAETEADERGFMLVKQAGYDVRETVKLFESIQKFMTDENEKSPFFFSSHPNITRRISNFNRLIAGQQALDGGIVNRDEFISEMGDLPLVNVSMCKDKGYYKTAQLQIEQYTAQHPTDGRAWVLLGDIFRERHDVPKGQRQREKKDDFVKAIGFYDKALAIDVNDVDALRGKGRALYSNNHKDEAKIILQQYLKLQPNAQDKSYIQQLIK